MASPSLDAMKSFANESTEQLRRSDELKALGNEQDSLAIASEWSGASIMNTVFLTIDSFIKQ